MLEIYESELLIPINGGVKVIKLIILNAYLVESINLFRGNLFNRIASYFDEINLREVIN